MKTATIAPLLVALSALASAAPTWDDWKKGGHPDSPFKFTSVYKIIATPDRVINGTTPTPGQPGAIGYYNYGINSKDNFICYVSRSAPQVMSAANMAKDITLLGVTGPYQSLALTATHIHEAVKGATGPPRIALPNPVGDDKYRRSIGCLTGPFKTGIIANGVDTGDGFTVKKIEDNPAGFFTDAHTKMYVPGVVRGQFA
jgi:CHRD domain